LLSTAEPDICAFFNPANACLAFAAKHSNLSLMTCQSLSSPPAISRAAHTISNDTNLQVTSLFSPHPAAFNTSLDSSEQTGHPKPADGARTLLSISVVATDDFTSL
jgi:hypothetical protein